MYIDINFLHAIVKNINCIRRNVGNPDLYKKMHWFVDIWLIDIILTSSHFNLIKLLCFVFVFYVFVFGLFYPVFFCCFICFFGYLCTCFKIDELQFFKSLMQMELKPFKKNTLGFCLICWVFFTFFYRISDRIYKAFRCSVLKILFHIVSTYCRGLDKFPYTIIINFI